MELTSLTVEREDPVGTLVLLHGLGGDEHDWDDSMAILDPDQRFDILSIRGPYEDHGNGWFMYGDPERVHLTLEPTLSAIEREITRVLDKHHSSQHIVALGGFSQGASTALAAGCATTASFRPAGVFAMGGLFPPTDRLAYDWTAPRRILIQHGSADRDTPVQEARAVAADLRSLGVPVEFKEYATGHSITPEALRDSSDWLYGLRRGVSP
ncbi:MAG TPA: hypothetical protein VM840_09445 [Actinomycetota bacterium]|nr:hypothetical protein [Actinomycetota bacterium]